MNRARVVMVLLLGIMLVSGLACDSDRRHDDLVALKAWHDKWDEVESQYSGWESHSVGNPENEDTFSELLYELMAIEPYGMPEYLEYFAAHRLYVAAACMMYTMYQSEKERFIAKGYDGTPCCPYLEIYCYQQPHSTEYEQACTVYRLACENLYYIRADGKWEIFSELD